MGECTLCEIEILAICPIKEIPSTRTLWRYYGKIIARLKDNGDPHKVI
jgi:hypothetical protein